MIHGFRERRRIGNEADIEPISRISHVFLELSSRRVTSRTRFEKIARQTRRSNETRGVIGGIVN